MKPGSLCALMTWCAVVFGDTSKIAFEVASIKPAQPSPAGQMRIGLQADAAMLRYTNVSLKEVIRIAYRVKDFQIRGPDWIDSARFDIVAKLPAGASQDQIPEMLQDLLTERFTLATHRETKEHPIYALVVAKGGPKLKPAATAMPEPPGPVPAFGKGPMGRGAMMMMVDPNGVHLKAAAASLAALAEMISRFSERPVMDMTGVQGQYEFDLVFAPEAMHGMPGLLKTGPPPGDGGPAPAEASVDGAATIFDAVQRYGLKLEPRKAPVEIVVIDHIAREPTEN
ncbi:MAG TPA: TIGR03435 family protein [Bryobacteraceae bacterium]|nr:TIGR03435 family protein [Bryobacteraceae bacterium]